MTTKQKMLLAVTSAVLISGGLLASGAYAQGNGSVSSLVSEIASKFNLKPADVQAVFDQHKQEMDAVQQQKVSDKLSQAVTDGKITATQKELILAKEKEVKQKMDSIRNLTDKTEQRKEINQLQSDLKTWAESNNIDTSLLRAFGPRHGMHGTGMMSHK